MTGDEEQRDEMRCDEFVLLVDDLISTPRDQWGEVVDLHLKNCPPCVTYLQQMLDLQEIFRNIRQGHSLPQGDIDDMVDKLTNEHSKSTFERRV